MSHLFDNSVSILEEAALGIAKKASLADTEMIIISPIVVAGFFSE
jgi:hypothetical protein